MEIRTLTDANKDVQALLTRTLKIAAEQYYNTGTASMSDFEFDRQAARLKEMEEKTDLFMREVQPLLSGRR